MKEGGKWTGVCGVGGLVGVGTDWNARRLRGGRHTHTHTLSHRHAVTHHLVQRVIGWIRPPSNISRALVTHFHTHTHSHSEQALEVTEWITAPCMTKALSFSHKYTFTHTYTA